MPLVLFFRSLYLLVSLAILTAMLSCANKTNAPAEKTLAKNTIETANSTYYAYTMLAPSAQGGVIIYARIVIDNPTTTCPTLTGSDQSIITTQKRPFLSGTPAARTHFPVTVCEAVIAEHIAYSNTTANIQLAAVTLNPSAVQVYGDSGCSHCQNPDPSPEFQALANQGATQASDLILHMGDYNYRGTSGSMGDITTNGQQQTIWAYDAGDGTPNDPQCELTSTYYSQNAGNSPKPDSWQNWQYDFFEPAKSLLPKAPWVFARGNHELCSRAGLGWFYFMGPGSSLSGGVAQMQCPDQGDFNQPPATATQHITMIPPYRLDLQALQLWVMDSANACDGYGVNALTAQYSNQYQQLQNQASQQQAGNKPTWLVSHRPLWGYQEEGSPTLNQMLQIALEKTPTGTLPADVSLSLAGHMHIYESLSFLSNSNLSNKRPPQIIIGNSGVSLSTAPAPTPFTATVDNQEAQGNALQQYGYLQINLNSNGNWQGNILGTTGNNLLNCNSQNPINGKMICR